MHRRFQVGQLEVVRVLELEFPLGPEILPIGSDPQGLAASSPWAAPEFVTESGDVVFALTATCLVSDGKRIVVDPCLSFDLRRDNPDIGERADAFFAALAAAGFPAAEVDLVVNSHIDGVGWNVRPDPGGWRPAFPRARHLFTGVELARVEGEADGANLQPLLDAQRVERVEMDHAVTSQVSLRPSPGHTPGNVEVWIESAGASAVVVGDHVLNPLQCADPDWGGLDANPSESARIRRALLEECAVRNTLVIGPHFGSPGAGRVRPEGGAWMLAAEP